LAYHPVQLPSEPFHVLALDAREAPPVLRDSLERMAVGLERRLFVVKHEENLVLLVDPTSRPHVEKILQRSAVRVGVSAQACWAGLSEALVQASAALVGAPSGRFVSFDDLRADTVVGLLDRPQVADLARLRLGQLLASPAGQARLREAASWLSLNGAWDPAARELGLHRHSLKQRINDLGRELDMPRETFHGRAELWALLVSVLLIT
jgi:purine catabolism regulator